MLNEATLENSNVHHIIPEDDYLTATNMMALSLLYEKHNPNSFWKEYIDYLPQHIHTYDYYIL